MRKRECVRESGRVKMRQRGERREERDREG